MADVKLSPQIPVAIFLTSFHPGGTERQMIELVERLDRSRFDVHVACFHDEGGWRDRVQALAPVSAFPIRGFARPATMAKAAAFVAWCRARRIAVVQTCDLYANTFALPAAALAGVPVRIGSRRELKPDKSAVQIGLQRQAYRFAHKVVANSPAAAAELVREGLRSARIHVIANGVRADAFSACPLRHAIRTVVTVANLRQEKGHETLIEAAGWLRARHPELRFLFVGAGPRRAALEKLVTARGLQETVVFTGHRDDIAALLAEADLFALPSRSEAFPNAAIEAMAAGLPVVASAVGGLLDLIEPERTGVLVPPGDSAALADAIDRLVSEPQRATRIGAAARQTVQTRYTFERMVQSFESLYLSQLEERGYAARSLGAAA
jgi:L-malate glycosyltransferase